MIRKQLYNFNKYPVLTRDFIYDRLYHPSKGYFNLKDIQIGELKEPINFKQMMGYEDYTREISDKYPKHAWLTPSELFKPWYGMSIGNYIHQIHQKKGGDLKIIEIGAGAASAADSILMFFKNYDKQLYNNLKYEIVELSQVMKQKAIQKLSVNHEKLIKNNQIQIIQDDIVNYRNENKKQNTFLIFLEVFDNMPHDRVYKQNNQYTLQTKVDQDHNGQLIEKLEPITDPIIKEVLDTYTNLPERDPIDESRLKISIFEKMFNIFYKKSFRQKSLFLPTHSYKILKNININFPNHHLIMADFDNLGSQIEGINAPIVSKKLEKSHEKIDYDSYFVDRGQVMHNIQADIFFPTDFHLLKELYLKACKKQGQQVKSFTFVDTFSMDEWTMTKSGYNPLKEDFMNTSFFVTSEN